MQLSVATNFDDQLVRSLEGYPVGDVYGKMSDDVIGGGRSSFMIGTITRRRLAKHVRATHDAGIEFNYLLNAGCIDNMEQTRSGHRRLHQLLDALSALGVDGVTVAVPFLLLLIKKRYPHFKVRISVFAQVDTVSKAQWWIDQGADSITLDYNAVNREFETLRRIAKAVDATKLQLMVNGHCVSRCPIARYHMNTLAHSSQGNHRSNGFNIDYCFLRCSTDKLRDPAEYLKGDWIRPEDLHLFEEMGYSRFKIVDRSAPTDVLLRRVQAYTARRYDGNLIDLIQSFGFKKSSTMMNRARLRMAASVGNLFKFASLKPEYLLKARRLALRRGLMHEIEDEPVYIDNRALDGFMDRFVAASCRDLDCDQCKYCDRWAERVVRMDPSYREECVRLGEELIDEFETSDCWR